MLNLNRLLYAQAHSDEFCSRITPDREQAMFFRECRDKVRDYLHPRISAATKSVLGMREPVFPRFRTQGSWNYDTCVQPYQHPPQEMDWDYGVYLPFDVWQENGPPEQMAKAYFDLVETMLGELCLEERWTLATNKPTCSRILVTSWAHMDIPLYGAPAEEFAKVVEPKRLAKALGGVVMEAAADSAERQTWVELDDVYLATRGGYWKPSDPNDVALWFEDRLVEAGPHDGQLRRVCRYLKAWRDFHWKSDGPTSVSIMIAVARAFQGISNRDDIVLQRAAHELSLALADDLLEPGIGGGDEDFNARLNNDGRRDASARASRLSQAINTARDLNFSQRHDAITALRSHLGDRIPNRPDWIQTDSTGDEIRNMLATKVAPPRVGASKAG
ncbi:CBASS cGAMP synthase [Paraburkholderia pallida]|uniref:Cyclic GMP-AMP synthase n=1 Tax=Paraburkholderia pallida TaxID=2547399 RepID=A0A4P7D1K4_9BURK|nr:hypothetical protein [Paraburkholderia pallida]QBR02499.1 hypothetical protein E1956_35240 [Paraburkholderia pallida]